MYSMNASANAPPAIVFVEIHDRRPDGHAHGAQVVREPRHEVARAHAREVRGVERLEMDEEIVSQVVFDPAAHAVQQLAHPVAANTADE